MILADDRQIPESHCRAHEREVISSGNISYDKHINIVPPSFLSGGNLEGRRRPGVARI